MRHGRPRGRLAVVAGRLLLGAGAFAGALMAAVALVALVAVYWPD